MNFGRNSHHFSRKFIQISISKQSVSGTHASSTAWSVIYLFVHKIIFFYLKEDEDPRRMYRLIHFLHALTNNKTVSSTFSEISCWSLIQNLSTFQWHIPSIWCDINEHAKLLLDHPSKGVRERIAE